MISPKLTTYFVFSPINDQKGGLQQFYIIFEYANLSW